MPRKKKNQLTTAQEHILLALSYLQAQEREGGYGFLGKSIARVMSGRWTKFRQEAIEELVTLGWIETHDFMHFRYYRIKDNCQPIIKVRFEAMPYEKCDFNHVSGRVFAEVK